MNKKCDDCGKTTEDVFLIDHMTYCETCFKARGGAKGTKQFECPECGLIFDDEDMRCNPADGCSSHQTGPEDL